MSIAKRVVSRPTTYLIIYALLVGMALYILPQVPIDLFPEINPPILVVSPTIPAPDPKRWNRRLPGRWKVRLPM